MTLVIILLKYKHQNKAQEVLIRMKYVDSKILYNAHQNIIIICLYFKFDFCALGYIRYSLLSIQMILLRQSSDHLQSS